MFGHSNNKVLFSPICYHKIKVTTVIILHIMDGSRNFQKGSHNWIRWFLWGQIFYIKECLIRLKIGKGTPQPPPPLNLSLLTFCLYHY